MHYNPTFNITITHTILVPWGTWPVSGSASTQRADPRCSPGNVPAPPLPLHSRTNSRWRRRLLPASYWMQAVKCNKVELSTSSWQHEVDAKQCNRRCDSIIFTNVLLLCSLWFCFIWFLFGWSVRYLFYLCFCPVFIYLFISILFSFA